jgi:hypothetical protein
MLERLFGRWCDERPANMYQLSANGDNKEPAAKRDMAGNETQGMGRLSFTAKKGRYTRY